MLGLLLKDLYNLRKYIKQVGLSIAVFALFAITLKSSAYLIGMIAMMTSMMVITSMAFDESAKWDKYALTMPLLKKDIVMEKYLLVVVTVISGAVLSGILAVIVLVLLKIGNMTENLLTSGIIALIAIFIFSILLPLLFKYGVEKARIIMAVVIAVPFLAFTGIIKLMNKLNIPEPGIEQLRMLGFAASLFVLVIFFISYGISVRIYDKKEF